MKARQKNGYTALILAGHYDLTEVAELLLENGADPHATAAPRLSSDSESDAAVLAWEHGHLESTIFLEKAKGNTGPLSTSPIDAFWKEHDTGTSR